MTYLDPVRRREPLFNIPACVTGLIVLMVAIHAVRLLAMTPDGDLDVILLFSFIPLRYASPPVYDFPGGLMADLWTPLTYGLLHGNLSHLLFNAVWLAAFGSVLARRFGAGRFLLFTALATVAGAAAHYLAHADDPTPVVGASAAISGHMAAVARFMFQAGGPLRANRRDPGVYHAEAVSLAGLWSDRRVLGFLGVWFALNLVVGLGTAPLTGGEVTVAWEAHVGGFLFGLLAFSLFDPPAVHRARRAPRPAADPSDRL